MGQYNPTLTGRGPPQDNGVVSIRNGVGPAFYGYIYYNIPPYDVYRSVLINRSNEIGRVPQNDFNRKKHPDAFDAQVGFTRTSIDSRISSNSIIIITGGGTVSAVLTNRPITQDNMTGIASVQLFGDTDRVKVTSSPSSATRNTEYTNIYDINRFNIYVDILDATGVIASYMFKFYIRLEKGLYRAQVQTTITIFPTVKVKGGNRNDESSIFLLATTDVISAANLGSVLFRVKEGGVIKEWMRRPKLTSVVKGKGCTLNDKTLYLNGPTGDITDD